VKNVFQFIVRYSYTMLFLLLELVAFVLLVQHNQHHGANFLGFAGEISGTFYSVANNTTQYFGLVEENERLANENALLRTRQKEYFYSLSPEVVYFGDTASTLQYTFVTAEVLQNSIHLRDNYITLNVGSKHGIEPEMGVISDDGIVGVVHKVSNHFCNVISVLNSKIKVGVQLKDNEYFGILTWAGYDPNIGFVQDIPSHVDIAIGDTIVTRGNSTIFPENIFVGTVYEIESNHVSGFHEITIDFTHDFRRDGYVYVVRDKFKTERLELENLEEDE